MSPECTESTDIYTVDKQIYGISVILKFHGVGGAIRKKKVQKRLLGWGR